nr:hypothetical protein [uncultured Roseovarius sp.]
MIGPDDIDAFRADNEDALKASYEYARRADKGIPHDRWTDGITGARLVAQGIKAQAEMVEMLSNAFLTILAEKQNAGRIYTSHSKYAQHD